MDYDNWLQKGAGCFDEHYETNNNEIFEWYKNNYADDITVDNILYDEIDDFPYVPYLVIERILDRMGEDDEFINAYDSGLVDDLNEYIRKYPERARVICEKYIPRNADDLWNLLGDKGWKSIKDSFYEYYN